MVLWRILSWSYEESCHGVMENLVMVLRGILSWSYEESCHGPKGNPAQILLRFYSQRFSCLAVIIVIVMSTASYLATLVGA